jgi:hypothetical protein
VSREKPTVYPLVLMGMFDLLSFYKNWFLVITYKNWFLKKLGEDA